MYVHFYHNSGHPVALRQEPLFVYLYSLCGKLLLSIFNGSLCAIKINIICITNKAECILKLSVFINYYSTELLSVH